MFPGDLKDPLKYPFKPIIIALDKDPTFNQEKVNMGQYG
jgi:hypothetical protein